MFTGITFQQRTDTYLGESRYEKPKQVFRLLGELITQSGLASPGASLLDVGCATGEMIYYLQRCFPAMRFTGVDNQPQLLAQATANAQLQQVTFIEADALNYRNEPQDIVTCFGMLGIFDQFEPLLENLLANTRKSGKVYIHGLFNDDDIDVRIYYRDHHNHQDWNRGFNIYSTTQLANWLKGRATSWRFLPFELEVDIPRRPETPHRAYTTKLEEGRRITTNGLCLMLPEKVLEITV